jgi:hypothetical protein
MVRIDIDLPTDEEQEQALRFRTYVNYLSTIGRFLRTEYADPVNLASRVVREDAYKRIQGGRTPDPAAVQRLLRNAWFTELQIHVAAPTDDLIPYSNHWAPVQLYYSIYLSIRAWYAALGHNVGTQHTTTLRAAAGEIRSRPSLFPYPWKLLVEGDPEKGTTSYENLPADVSIGPISSLEQSPSFWDSFAMFLRTTRQRQLDRAIDDWKRRHKRRRIKASERAELSRAFPPTSLFDGLYRLRIRSNYADADTFLLSLESEAEAIQFHRALRAVGWCSMLLLELLISASVGRRQVGEWVESFNRYDVAGHSKKTIRSRWDVIRKAS